MATREDIIAEEWRERAPELADWAMANLVNRKDVWGQYAPLTPSEQRSLGRSYKAMTLPQKHLRGGDKVTIDKLTRHFASRHDFKPQIIGLHAKSEAATSRWFGIDIDLHDHNKVGAEEHARRNLNAAVGWWRELQGLGHDPILLDTNGHGGYHLWVLFADPAPTEDVFAMAHGFATRWAEAGLDEEPETFPKKLKEDSIGSWFRLPGLHHSLPHHARVWSGDEWLDDPWLDGHAAIDHLLAVVPGPPPPKATLRASDVEPRVTRHGSRAAAITGAAPAVKKATMRKQSFPRSARPRVCVDLDGVLADRTWTRGRTRIGDPIPGAVEFTRELAEFADIVILTARFHGLEDPEKIARMEDDIRDWLDENRFSYTRIWTESAKPPAQAYIDDHGVYCCPAKEGIGAFDTAMAATRMLCHSPGEIESEERPDDEPADD